MIMNWLSDRLKSRQAARLAARGQYSDELPEAMADRPDWVGVDPALRSRLSEFQNVDRAVRSLRNTAFANRLVAAAYGDAARRRRRFTWGWLFAGVVAATLVAGFAIHQFVTVGGLGGGPQVYLTAQGEQYTTRLVDGSVIELNTDSRVVVDYAESARRVYLEKGEAHITVARDTRRPFYVYAGNSVIEAIGTQFQVYRTGGEVKVTLVEGEVEITRVPHRDHDAGNGEPMAAEFSLKPGQQVVIDESGRQPEIKEVDLQWQTAWRDGMLIFDDHRLVDVVDELNRYSARRMVIEGNSVKELRLTAVLRIGDLDTALFAMESLLDVKHEERADGVIVLRDD